MLRWGVSLALLLALLAVGVGGIFWFTRITTDKVEALRQVRVQHQTFEQHLALLQSPGMTPLITTLQEDLDTLQIKLVEVVTHQPLPAGVLDVGYEQIILPQAMSDGSGETIRVLRLKLTLTVEHSGGLLAMLDRIDHAVDAWPHETRGCELLRLPQQILHSQCVVDFYHWSMNRELELLQSGHMQLESPAWA